VPRQRQVDAVRFLNENAFATPQFFLDEAVLRRIEVDGAITRVGRAQTRLLAALLSDARMSRMVEFEALAARSGDVYALGDLLTDVRQGIWSELRSGPGSIDAFRRNLQRAYLDTVDGKLNPPPRPATAAAQRTPPGDALALLRGDLRALDTELRAALPRAADRTTRLHLEDARVRIARILEPLS